MSLEELRRSERLDLLETLRQVGPEAPTLCAQWSAADLAAHLVASERHRGLPMVVAYKLRAALPAGAVQWGMGALQRVGDRQLAKAKAEGWDRLLARLASGPPAAYRLNSVAPIRLVEEWVHHEDIRRANDMPARAAPPNLDEALWQAGLLLSSFNEFTPGRQGLLVTMPDGRSQLIGDTVRVRILGPAGEILLYLAGRTTAAKVTVTGEDEALRAMRLSI